MLYKKVFVDSNGSARAAVLGLWPWRQDAKIGSSEANEHKLSSNREE
jgi:hypothetical protein